MTLYLDMDGVIADFDAAARKSLGTDNSYKWEWIHGTDAFWETLERDTRFWIDMKPMPDFHVLWNAVRHLEPVVLTALPKIGADQVDKDKRTWIEKNLSSSIKVITCQTMAKPRYCDPGDILVDDRMVNANNWRFARGHFVLHRDAMSTLDQLKDLKVI